MLMDDLKGKNVSFNVIGNVIGHSLIKVKTYLYAHKVKEHLNLTKINK